MWLAIISMLLVPLMLYLLHKKSFPGPSPLLSLPVVGHSWLLGSNPIEKLLEFKEKYGDVVCLDMGSRNSLVLFEPSLIRAVFGDRRSNARAFNEYQTLRHIVSLNKHGNVADVSLNKGEQWREQRKFLVKTIHNLGLANEENFGNMLSQESNELGTIIESLADEGRSRVHLKHLYTAAINNVIWRMATGHKTKQRDEGLLRMTREMSAFFEALNPGNVLGSLQISSMRFTRFCRMIGITNVIDLVEPIKALVRSEISSAKSDSNGSFVERFLFEIDCQKSNKESSFNDQEGIKHLEGGLFGLFLAGTEALSALMEWATFYLVAYPHLQNKVREEIDEFLNSKKEDKDESNEEIRLEHRSHLHYTQAFLQEVQRHGHIFPLAFPRVSTEDIELKNYGKIIPKGTQIFYLNTAVHRDPLIYGDPETFRPERYLDDDKKFVRDDKLLLFGHGQRKCAGEALAKSESFVLFANLVRRFKFDIMGEKFKPWGYRPGLAFYPPDIEIRVRVVGVDD